MDFEVDGPTFARYIQEQFKDSTPADAPPGLTNAPSPLISGMSGNGQLWVDESGLPRRQILELSIPNASEQYNVEVYMVVDLRYGQGDAYVAPPTTRIATQSALSTFEIQPETQSVAPVPADSLPSLNRVPFYLADGWIESIAASLLLVAVMLMITAALILRTRSRKMYLAVALSISFMILSTPLFRVHGMELHQDRQEDGADNLPTVFDVLNNEKPTPAESSEAEDTFKTPGLVQQSALIDPGVACGDGLSTADTDNDSLSDDVENCLGTDPYYFDSDRDTITDTLELDGFTFNNLTWYMDPLLGDSNFDGLSDYDEWVAPIGKADSWDPDGDLIPNPWDDDNDGDGIWDSADLSPYSLTGFADSFTFTTQIEDSFSGYQYFELQIRPEDPDHLRYSTSLIDWPQDDLGQLQDLDNSTEDVSISPMLAITTDQIPEESMRNLYGLSYFTNEDGTNVLYAPLAPVNDGGQIVAFQTRFGYGPETLGAISWEEVKFVWLGVPWRLISSMVTTLRQRSRPYPVLKTASSLPGGNVGKHADYDFVVMGTPGSPNSDRDIFSSFIWVEQHLYEQSNPRS